MMSRNAVLCRPAHGLGVVLNLERGFLHVVHHPEQHRIDADRDRVRGQRLLGRKTGRNCPLVDPTGDPVGKGHHPEQSRTLKTDELAESQDDRLLPLLGDLGRLHEHESQ